MRGAARRGAERCDADPQDDGGVRRDTVLGWQVQPGRPTIQGVLEDRLSRMLQETIRLAGAGRTDAGVHALAQVASFTTACRVPLDGLRAG